MELETLDELYSLVKTAQVNLLDNIPYSTEQQEILDDLVKALDIVVNLQEAQGVIVE